MIRFYNKALFKESTITKTGAKGDYLVTSLETAVPAEDNKGNESTRLVSNIRHDVETELNGKNTRVSFFTPKVRKEGEKTTPVAQFSQGDISKHDTDVFFLAIPFRGIMAPIKESLDYRIYKGFILKTAKDAIEVDRKKYNRAAYIIMSIDTNVFNEDNKYHKDSIEMVVDTYHIFKNKENNNTEETQKVSFTFIFTKAEDGSITYDCACKAEPSEGIDIDSYKGTPLFPIYVPKEKSFDDKKKPYKKDDNRGRDNHSDDSKKRFNNDQRPVKSDKVDGGHDHGEPKDFTKRDNRRKDFKKKDYNNNGDMRRPKSNPYNNKKKRYVADRIDYDAVESDGSVSNDNDDDLYDKTPIGHPILPKDMSLEDLVEKGGYRMS